MRRAGKAGASDQADEGCRGLAATGHPEGPLYCHNAGPVPQSLLDVRARMPPSEPQSEP